VEDASGSAGTLAVTRHLLTELEYKYILILVMTNIRSLEALADPTRRAIFERLRSGPRSVNELAGVVPVSQPAVSQHLRVLKEARLVRVRKAGNRRIYSLDPEGLAELRSYFEELWDDVLGAFQEAAEQAR
jgi:DNA-binding transcriptional ArsR family regulator